MHRFPQSLLAIFILLLPPLIVQSALAQIAPDATWGNERSRVRENAELGLSGRRGTLIQGGATRGRNLFHGFSSFNVRAGERVFFENPENIDNIITRITGNSRSTIDGLLGVEPGGNANLFLINPKGIQFGENAVLELNGSFITSTADRVLFRNGITFATQPPPATLLTISAPIGLQFGATSGSITIQTGSLNANREPLGGLQVKPNQTLAIVGGNIRLNNGQLLAPDGHIELGSVSAFGTANFSFNPSGIKLNYPGDRFGDIRIADHSTVQTTGATGSGDLQVQGRRLYLADGSQLSTQISGSNPGGRLTVHTAESVALFGSSTPGDRLTGLITDSQSGRADGGNAGAIDVATQHLEIRNGAQITSFTSGGGDSGNIQINATESIRAIGSHGSQPSGITSGTRSSFQNNGNAGRIDVTTRQLILQNGAQLFSITFGQSNAGQIRVSASDLIRVRGTATLSPNSTAPTGIPAIRNENGQTSLLSLISTQSQGAGRGGALHIDTRRLVLRDAGQIAATALSSGDAGSIRINAAESLEIGGRRSADRFSSSGIFAQVDFGASGNGGALSLTTGRLTVQNGGRVTTGTIQRSTGRGGELTVNASSIDLSGSNVFRIPRQTRPDRVASALSSESLGSGSAGKVTIHTDELHLGNGAEVSVQATNAGNLQIQADQIRVGDHSRITAQTSSGQGGNIHIDGADTVQLNRGEISAQAAVGNGGNINLTDIDRLQLDSNSQITAATGGGRGGNVSLDVAALHLNQRNQITAATTGSANGGRLSIQASDRILLGQQNQITTSAGSEGTGGSGGNITLGTQFLIARSQGNNDITANAFSGSGGRIHITAQTFLGLAAPSRAELTTLEPSNSLSNDITAFSQVSPQLDGEVTINTPNLDPSQGAVELPADIIDASRLVAQGCATGRTVARAPSQFIVTGRGGLSPSPIESLGSKATTEHWITLLPTLEHVEHSRQTEHALGVENRVQQAVRPHQDVNRITEAQGWIVGKQGEIVLVTESPTDTLVPSMGLSCNRLLNE
ncbi:MAG: S-layer family protein [Drouetiella hepatica Uher 2000/2452]|jgi:filamentous hemagglutinin family protein|uniref:S-layer family protein n=1 Tax=Drouetiella hepatica Uher 2000/2452 TaxID=904376 RepID=A0A951QGR1_9CYAN|nr:S-layer family protein [Drouetiella hepatica Uher 2000/2452]